MFNVNFVLAVFCVCCTFLFYECFIHSERYNCEGHTAEVADYVHRCKTTTNFCISEAKKIYCKEERK